MSSIFLFTHSDLDGAACATLCKYVYGDSLQTIKFCNYDNIDKELNKFLDDNKEESKAGESIPLLLITDICPSNAVLDRLDTTYFMVGLLDHHKTKEQTLLKHSYAIFDKTKCGAELVLDFLNKSSTNKYGKLFPEVEEWIQCISAWDLWKTNSPYRKRAESLNALCFFLGMEEFVNVFSKNINADRLPEYQNLLKQLEHNKNEYVNKIIKEQLHKTAYCMGLGHTYKILIASDFISEIGQAALAEEDSEDLHFIAIVNPLNNTISFRSRQGENVDVAVIAKRLGGGGHFHSSGAPIDLHKLTKNKAYNLIKSKE